MIEPKRKAFNLCQVTQNNC